MTTTNLSHKSSILDKLERTPEVHGIKVITASGYGRKLPTVQCYVTYYGRAPQALPACTPLDVAYGVAMAVEP